MNNKVIHALYQMHKGPVIDTDLESRIRLQLGLGIKSGGGIRKRDESRMVDATRWLIAVLIDSVRSGRAKPVVLPLGHDSYQHKRFGYRLVARVLDACRKAKVLRLKKAKPDIHGGHATEILATKWFVTAYKKSLIPWIRWPSDTSVSEVLLTDYDDFLDLRSTEPVPVNPETKKWAENLGRINDFNQTQPIFLMEDDRTIRHLLADHPITFNETRYVRSFCRGRLDCGGRFYNTWWQQIPSAYRSTISIDSQPVVEFDYSAMAIRLLYAKLGLQPPTDPYDLGLSSSNAADKRKILKRFVLAITNDRKAKFRLKRHEYELLGVSHPKLVHLLTKKHPAISHFFFKDSGVELQHLDSIIAEQVMLEGVSQGILILSVHDSFIAQERHEKALKDIMRNVYTREVGWPPVIRKEEAKRQPTNKSFGGRSLYSLYFRGTFLQSEALAGRRELLPGGLADLLPPNSSASSTT